MEFAKLPGETHSLFGSTTTENNEQFENFKWSFCGSGSMQTTVQRYLIKATHLGKIRQEESDGREDTLRQIDRTIKQEYLVWISNYQNFDQHFLSVDQHAFTPNFVRDLLFTPSESGDQSIMALSAYSALALSALRSRSPQAAHELYSRARRCLGHHFDSSNYQVAECLLILAVYTFLHEVPHDQEGKMSKCSYYLTLALSICERLGLYNSNVFIFGLYHHILFLILAGDLGYATLIGTTKKFAWVEIGEKHPRNSLRDVVRYVTDFVGSLHLFRKCFSTPQFCPFLRDLKNHITHLQQQFESTLCSLQDSPSPICNTFTLLLYAAQVGAARTTNNRVDELKWAARFITYVQTEKNCPSLPRFVCGFIFSWVEDVIATFKDVGAWRQAREALRVLEGQSDRIQNWVRNEECVLQSLEEEERKVQGCAGTQRTWWAFSASTES